MIQKQKAMKPLEGITIIDMTIALAGPYATLLLGGLGARIIKVENPEGGDVCRNNSPFLGKNGATLTRQNADDISISALNRLRNKESITLNLKNPAAKNVLADLMSKADVLVENFSNGTLDRLGLGYEFAKTVNPRLIYCAITGFGSGEEIGDRKAMDSIIQALSGVMMTSGADAEPPIRVGVPFGDLNAPLFGVIGILSALLQRERSGAGQFVDISMLGALTSMVACESFDVLEQCGISQRTGMTVPRLAPFGMFPTKDGYITIAAPTEVFARNLFHVMGRPELATDVRFSSRDSRVKNEHELNRQIEIFTRSMNSAEAVHVLNEGGVPAAEVRTPGQAMRDPQVIRRKETMQLEHPKYGRSGEVYGMGIPITFSDAAAGLDTPAPDLGEHNETLYCDFLGYSKEKFQHMIDTKVI